jgi:hypothetical protein
MKSLKKHYLKGSNINFQSIRSTERINVYASFDGIRGLPIITYGGAA